MAKNIRAHKKITPELGKGVYVDHAATVIGNVVLGDDVSVWPGAVIRGDMHEIKIGCRSNIQDNAVLHITHPSPFNPNGWPLIIGEDVIVGHGAILHGCKLGNKILVGNGAIINDGAVVQDEVLIGAGTIVPPGKVLTSGNLYIGSPARVLRKTTKEEKDFFTYSPANYVSLKNEYLKNN
ncbi:MAG: gamma carbonic anhydrase family protein [Porticoccus sp.]|jgi:carbonic anhydrase/acetyltransferase-like protein (isoleucine patch superfamily)|nr:gamma carbonic anhydrase family protein [Porticoccus sp.]|tara:strand:+ start:193 stop:732 length:540 start_codon:yes stop_codon:yes gene_type:complete